MSEVNFSIDGAMPLLVKEDAELGYAFFCPRCKTWEHTGGLFGDRCRQCGQLLDYKASRTEYHGKVRWER